MFSNKKKGLIAENKFAKNTMRFVFAFLSFFFVLTGKSFAETKQYKYIFDVGEGHKFTYTVEEDLSYKVTNPNRYKILNKELEGWTNVSYGYIGDDPSQPQQTMAGNIGCDLGQDSQKTIYNWCTYLQRITTSSSSRKFMKSLIIMFIEQGYDARLGDSGNAKDDVPYLRPGHADDNASDAVSDNDYNYSWYYDTYWANYDFKKAFDSTDYNKTPYVRSYLREDHIYLKNSEGQTVSLWDKITSDKTVLSYINLAIENGTATGTYFAPMKVEVSTIQQCDTLVWWYREGSYNEKERSILIDCAKNLGDKPLFTFKYSATGEFLEEPPYVLKTNENSQIVEFKDFEYHLNLSDAVSGNTIYVYPDFTGGSRKTCKNKFKQGKNCKEQTGQFYLACNGVSFAQTGAQYIYVTDFSQNNFYSTGKYNGTAYGDKVCTIPAEELNKIIIAEGGKLDDGLLFKYNNGYTFAYNPETGEISFFKTDDPAEVNYIGMNMNLKKMYAPFVDSPSKNVYGISLKADPRGRSLTGYKNIWDRIDYEYQYRLNVLTTANNRTVYNEQGEKYDVSWSMAERKKAMFYNLYEDADIDCLLSVRDLSEIAEGYRGDTKNTCIPVDKCPVIAEVSIRDWLEIEYKSECDEASKHAKIVSESNSLTAALKSIEETRKEMVPFIEMLFRYARPLILFLVLISICMTAIYSIISHNDPEKRAYVKVRIKNIAVGILVFAVSALIVALCIEYFNQAADMMFVEETDMDLNITSPYSMDKNWLLKILLKLIGVIANAIKWVIDFLATRMLRLDQREVDLANCIFGVENGGGVTLYPFEEQEWTMYMFGYQMLSILAVAFVAIAIVKNIVMILIGAGDAEKMTLVKQDFLRVFIAIMAVIFVPYCVRLMLTIVNNLVLLLPVSANAFNLDFKQYNDLEPICNLIYYIIEIKVYLAFVVRKVMIAFLLIATPVIFGIWAISDKFRSFNLWLGEMMTNIFMQFTYGFAFFFLVMVISNTKNPIVLLMMLSMLMKLADFVKDSLQGLFNQWGGINETGIAEEAFRDISGAPAKVWGVANDVRKKAGSDLMKASKAWDKTGTSKASKNLNNVGAVLSGNFRGIKTEKDRLENIKKLSESTKGKSLRKEEASLQKQIEANLSLTGDVNAKQLYMKALEGNLTPEEVRNMKNAGGVLGSIADLATVKDDLKSYDSKIKEIDKSIDEIGGLATLRGSVSKEVLGELKKQSKEEKNNVADIYEHTLDDFDRLEDQMNETIDKLSNPELSSEDKTKEEATLKHVLEQVIDKAQIISEVSVELNMTGGLERMEKIKNAQASAVREKANRFDKELKTEAMDSIQTTQDNFETLENRMKTEDNAPKDISQKEIPPTSNN